MESRQPVPRRNEMKVLAGFLVVPPLLCLLAASALFLVNQTRNREASAAMAVTPAPIDGQRAYKYLKQVCEIGPRTAGSAANARQRQLVARHFQENGARVTEQPFTGADPLSNAPLSMVNLIGSWHPERTQRVVIGAHYDTRPFPDEERDPARRKLPFIGANDCASGVALMMEIAHHLDKLATPWGVDLVLFDGEELVYARGQGEEQEQIGEYFLGSKEFARVYADGVDSGRLKSSYAAGFVLDMVGGRDLKIDQEENSLNLAPGLVRDVWAVARQVKATAFRPRRGMAVLDDHLPLNNAGIPSIDLIQFPYRYWHTSQDLPEHCSADSLEQVGRVLTAWLSQSKRAR